jgi:uncharacterized membrane protein
MAHAENEVVINKPIDTVYAFLADGTNNPKWRDGVISIEKVSGEIGAVETVYTQVLKGPGGRTIAGDYKIVVAQPNKELSFIVTAGPARPTGNYYFEELAEGTKLRFVLDFQPSGLMKLMGPMIQKTMDQEISQLAQLKTVLEQQ